MIAGSHSVLRVGWALPLLLTCWLVSAAQAAAPASGLQPIPPLTARVTDLTGTLTAEQQSALEQKLAAFEDAKGSQLAVLMVPTTHPEEIEQYSIRVVDQWKLGRGTVGGKKVDDGALLLVAKDDHRVRIEVGYGLEGVLTDAMSNRIISETIAPAFREGNFYAGIDGGLDQMMKLVSGEPLPPPEHSWQSGRHTGTSVLPELLFAVLIGSVVLRAIFGRTIGSILTGLGAGALVWIAGYALALAGIAAIGAFLITMLLGLARAGSGWSSYPRSGGFGGGWGGFGGGYGGGGFGGGGFGGGGFSGGGGGFGGGGSSGSW
ncbi:MAG TPA: YgcG family protein [Steroidobacteraceae bacterium]|nr:YgcG family protein [Steroidobacteraceae bacterium]